MADVTRKKSTVCKPYMSYDSLPDNYVRLLRIQPPQNPSIHLEAEIEISLISVPLADCPPYVTLSYTWTDPEPFVDPTSIIFTTVPRCYPIQCGNRLILCTRNLRDALRRLRELELCQKPETASGASREHAEFLAMFNANIHVYWIDAICIDQNDLHERSKQVSLMSQIYRRTQCTIVWYGEADAYTKTAGQVLQKISGRGTPSPDSSLDVSDFNPPPNFLKDVLQSLDDTEFEALGMFMARKWNSRTWILQEVILSPRVLVTCGIYSFHLDLLLRAATSIALSGSSPWSALRFAEIFAKRDMPDLHDDVLEHFVNIPSTLTSIYGSRQKLRENKKPNFLNTVSMSQHSRSTDLRDKIFGILALAAEFDFSETLIYNSDYEQTVAEVYTSATAFIIKARDDLACLSLVCDSSFKKTRDLPSWCPDYNSSHPSLGDTANIGQIWRLGLCWSETPNLEITDTSMLIVDGCPYDVVTETSALQPKRCSEEIAAGLSAVFNIATRLKASESTARRHHGPFETLWRTFVLDEFHEQNPAPAITAYLLPIAIPILLPGLLKNDPQGSKKSSFQVFEELRKLEAIEDQLKGMGHHDGLDLPDFNNICMQIDRLYFQRGADADFQECILDGCTSASISKLRRLNRFREQVPSDFTISTGSDETFFGLSETEQFNLIRLEIMGRWRLRNLENTYFKTKNTLGTGQPSVRDGDEIWFLHGAFAPVILRPLATGKYRFMSEAYVHEVMYGEAGAECVTRKRIAIV